jgi:hypothetical protein
MARKPDSELQVIRRIMAILQQMPEPQRRRVLLYIGERLDLMPPVLQPRNSEERPGETDLLQPSH